MCKRNGETVDHLLLYCEITSALWSAIFSCLGLTWIMPIRVVDLFTCWRGLGGGPQYIDVWKLVLFCLLWCL
jgi:hypothetical protein